MIRPRCCFFLRRRRLTAHWRTLVYSFLCFTRSRKRYCKANRAHPSLAKDVVQYARGGDYTPVAVHRAPTITGKICIGPRLYTCNCASGQDTGAYSLKCSKNLSTSLTPERERAEHAEPNGCAGPGGVRRRTVSEHRQAARRLWWTARRRRLTASEHNGPRPRVLWNPEKDAEFAPSVE